MKWTKVAALLLIAMLLFGCSNAVVGRVGEAELKQDDVDKRLALFKLFSPDFDTSTIDRADIVDGLLEEQVVLSEAEKEGITVEDEEVEAAFQEIKQSLENQFGDEKKMASALKKFKLTMDDLKKLVENNMKIQQLYIQITADVEVPDEEVQKYYQDHIAEFKMPEQVKASHILVEEEKVANELKERLEKGDDFAELAKEHSIDPGSRESGGELGYFPRGQMVAEFDQAAFSTPVGELSSVTKTNHGYHIIKVEDKKPARTLTLEEVKPFLSMQLEAQKKDEKFLTYIEEIKTKYKPENKLAKDKPNKETQK
ncbi:MAG TPA: foldase [Firmicutes bacterium]|jgi:foldase protein PrsA|nr:foldase [Bacillota bacterium]